MGKVALAVLLTAESQFDLQKSPDRQFFFSPPLLVPRVLFLIIPSQMSKIICTMSRQSELEEPCGG